MQSSPGALLPPELLSFIFYWLLLKDTPSSDPRVNAVAISTQTSTLRMLLGNSHGLILLPVARVCQAWYASAIAMVYECVCVTDAKHARLFLRAIQTSKRGLGPCVKELELLGAEMSETKQRPWKQRQEDSTLHRIFARCPNLNTLLIELSSRGDGDESNGIVRAVPSSDFLNEVRYLKVSDDYVSQWVAHGLAHGQIYPGKLERLDLFRTRFPAEGLGSAWMPMPMPQLRFLLLWYLNINRQTLLSMLTGCANTLETLVVASVHLQDGTESTPWPALPALRRLSLSMERHSDSVVFHSLLASCGAKLEVLETKDLPLKTMPWASFARLRYLSLRFPTLPSGESETASAARALEHVRFRDLDTLILRGSTKNAAVLVEKLLRLAILHSPRLRRVYTWVYAYADSYDFARLAPSLEGAPSLEFLHISTAKETNTDFFLRLPRSLRTLSIGDPLNERARRVLDALLQPEFREHCPDFGFVRFERYRTQSQYYHFYMQKSREIELECRTRGGFEMVLATEMDKEMDWHEY